MEQVDLSLSLFALLEATVSLGRIGGLLLRSC